MSKPDDLKKERARILKIAQDAADRLPDETQGRDYILGIDQENKKIIMSRPQPGELIEIVNHNDHPVDVEFIDPPDKPGGLKIVGLDYKTPKKPLSYYRSYPYSLARAKKKQRDRLSKPAIIRARGSKRPTFWSFLLDWVKARFSFIAPKNQYSQGHRTTQERLKPTTPYQKPFVKRAGRGSKRRRAGRR